MNPNVDLFIADGCGRCKHYATENCKVRKWQKEIKILRSLLLETGLKEELKWSQPVYTYNNKNILLLSAFKEHCFINFFKGVLLKDELNLLEKPGENSQTARYLKFSDLNTINSIQSTIKEYIFEAIEVEKSQLKVKFKTIEQYTLPKEFENLLEENSILKTAFNSLTPGRKRGYLIHFASAKQKQTLLSRIEKCMPKILEGKGINE